MEIQLSDHFNYSKLLRFTFPSVLMMIFTSIYGMVDGYFVSNFVGKTEFAALNFIWPVTMIPGAIGYMIGTGGTALVAKILGEGDKARANAVFSLMIYFAIGLSLLLDVIGLAVLRPVAVLMGAEGELLDHAMFYGSIIMAAMPTFVMQVVFQPFMVAAEKPKLGLWMTVAAGVTNMVLDWLLIGVFRLGLGAAAVATVFSQLAGALWPLIYFSVPNRSLLRLGRPLRDLGALLKACSNGLSELVTNVALSVVCLLYNARLLAMAGENGVSAYGVIMYVAILFLAVFFGYALGVSPVVSFHFGAGNRAELRNLRWKSFCLQSVAALFITVAGWFAAPLIARIFTGYDAELCAMSARAFRLYSLSFALAHFNIFASSFFTALNDGVTSAVISFSRMLVFQISALYLLPLVLGLDGVWLAMPVAEVGSFILSVSFYLALRHKFGY